jgi:diamine N-acetyltransferase
MKLIFRECVIDDLVTLRELSCKTYSDTFEHMNTPSNMKAYLEQAYDIGKLRGELSNINSTFYFLYNDEKLSGYLKLNEHKAQTDIYDPQSLEIERIYVTKEFQGRGLGSVLMNKAIDIANIQEKSYIWLGVWEKNDKAILFYKKNGFYVIGKHSFFMGEEEQTDFIMRKDLILSN